MLDNAQKQYLRESVIEYLAKRSTMSFSVTSVHRGISRSKLVDFPVSEADIAEALAILDGLGFVRSMLPRLGSIKEYQITSDGVLFYERSGE